MAHPAVRLRYSFVLCLLLRRTNMFDRLQRLMPKWNVREWQLFGYCEGDASFPFQRGLRRLLN